MPSSELIRSEMVVKNKVVTLQIQACSWAEWNDDTGITNWAQYRRVRVLVAEEPLSSSCDFGWAHVKV